MKKTHLAARSVLFGLFYILSGLFSLAVNADALSTGWIKHPNHPPLETRFVFTGQVHPQQKTVAGFLEVRLSDDWKTYWRSPGEAGIAPSMTWDKSTNISKVTWYWPFPERFNLLGIETFGYKENVIFPMIIDVEDINSPVIFKSNLTLSSCTTICVLTDYPFELTFIPSQLIPSESAMHLYAQALSQVPRASPLIGDISAIWDANKNKLQITVNKIGGWNAPSAIIDGNSPPIKEAAFTQPRFSIDGEKLVVTFNVTSWMGAPQLAGEDISISLNDENFIAEHRTTVISQSIIDVSSQFTIAQIVLFAIFGGLILNIMPCVLPVLGMKLTSIVSAHGLEKRQIRLQFLATVGGILCSFWLIAVFLAVLKFSGSAIGWGIQFQSGWFIGLMVLITGLFSANMLGLFDIRLPSSANTWIAAKGNNSYLGHFIQGMFATLLATPCSAPFLGTAVAFALATNIPTMFLIFTALALGMALPWIMVATFPAMALALPRPGAWMNKLKCMFGMMMLITSIWLLTILANHIPILWAYLIALGAIITIIVRTLSVYGPKITGWLGSIVIVVIAGWLVTISVTADKWVTPLPADLDWKPLSTIDITRHVENGDVVFVDITAQWCITCKANKIGVLLQEPIYSLLQHPNVIPMQGDWTRPNNNITSFLQENGRFGVPFNVIYGPNAPNGIPLPVILNSHVIIEAINHAKGNNQR